MIICGKCRSDDVQLLAWVNSNTKEFVEWHDLSALGWCTSCGSQVDTKYLPDDFYMKKYGKKDEEGDVSGREVDNSAGSDS